MYKLLQGSDEEIFEMELVKAAEDGFQIEHFQALLTDEGIHYVAILAAYEEEE